jgi:hypothetical protein
MSLMPPASTPTFYCVSTGGTGRRVGSLPLFTTTRSITFSPPYYRPSRCVASYHQPNIWFLLCRVWDFRKQKAFTGVTATLSGHVWVSRFRDQHGEPGVWVFFLLSSLLLYLSVHPRWGEFPRFWLRFVAGVIIGPRNLSLCSACMGWNRHEMCCVGAQIAARKSMECFE